MRAAEPDPAALDRALLRDWRAMRPVAAVLAEQAPRPPAEVWARLARLLECEVGP